MGETAFRSEDRVGLLVALILHAALLALLLVQPMRGDVLDFPDRMTVSLVADVGLEATAPNPVPESRAAIAPTLGDEAVPDAEASGAEEAAEAPPPRESRSVAQQPAPNRDRSRPDRQPREESARATRNSGGSRIGNDFLPGQGSSTRTDDTRIPASRIGASARASLQQAINRQLKPHWTAPQGLDAEQLVTVLAFRLNEDGSLAGPPRVVSQSGVTESNRPQAPLHAERAKRAVQQAAPFDLPDEYYEAWKNITAWRFDRRL